jgi:YggT family protein
MEADWDEGEAMYALFWLIDQLIGLYVWALIIAAVFSLLVSFNVLDTRNRFVWTIGDFLYKVTEPALRPIRRFMPDLGGIDLSPMILILLLYALRIFLWQSLWPLLAG